jgi:predicted permease
MRSVTRLLEVNPGFAASNLLTMQLYLPRGGYAQWGKLGAFNHELEQRLGALPGVSGVGLVTRLPLMTGRNNITHAVEIQDRPVPPLQRPETDIRGASTGYFQAMGIPLLRGRLVTPQDRGLAVVNEAMARRMWPGEEPLGKTVRTVAGNGNASDWHTIVGVVGSVRHVSLEAEPARRSTITWTSRRRPARCWWCARAPSPRGAIAAVRTVLQQMDARLALSNLETMDALVAESTAARRFGMLLLGVFAALALVLAAIGLYGVMSYATAQRTQELGVRMALGAREGDVVRMVVRQGMALAVGGAALGLVAAVALTRVMANLLYGVTATDPPTFVGVSLLLALVALLACYLPARRAARVDPMRALRSE